MRIYHSPRCCAHSKQGLRHGSRHSPESHLWPFCMEESPERTRYQLQDFSVWWAPEAPKQSATYPRLLDFVLFCGASAQVQQNMENCLACHHLLGDRSPLELIPEKSRVGTAPLHASLKIRPFPAVKISFSTCPWAVQSYKLQSYPGTYPQVAGHLHPQDTQHFSMPQSLALFLFSTLVAAHLNECCRQQHEESGLLLPPHTSHYLYLFGQYIFLGKKKKACVCVQGDW